MATKKREDDAVNAAPRLTKDEMRAKIFSAQSMNRKTITVQFFGAEIELRQPTVGEVEKLLDRDTGKVSMVQVLIDHAYVPGSDDKVFDIADTDQLKTLPFNEDMQKLADAVGQLTNVKVKDAEKNSVGH